MKINTNHSIKTINKLLEKTGHQIRKKDGVFYLQEEADPELFPYRWQDCGAYFKKKDIVEYVNQLLTKPNLWRKYGSI